MRVGVTNGKATMKAFRCLVLANGEATAADAKQASLDTQHRVGGYKSILSKLESNREGLWLKSGIKGPCAGKSDMTYFIILTIDLWYLWFMSADLLSVVCFLGMFFHLTLYGGLLDKFVRMFCLK